MKFYNLPVEPPDDRHKWFYSPEEAERFIEYRSNKNGFKILQMDFEAIATEKGNIATRFFMRLMISKLVRQGFKIKNLYVGTLWALLERK